MAAIDFPNPATQNPLNTFSPTSTPSSTSNGYTYIFENGKWVSSGEGNSNPIFDSVNTNSLAGFRNQLINGDFLIWQRGTSFSGTPNLATRTYITDRWASYSSTAARINGPFGYAISVSGPSSAAGGNQNQLMQVVETLPGKSGPFINGSAWTISAWLATTDTAATA